MAFNGRFVLNLIDFAAQLGASTPELVELSGMSEVELCQEECFITDEVYNTIVERAVKATKDPFFGLHAAENLNLSAAGLIAQITQTSETVKQALDYCVQFANLGCSALPMSLQLTGDEYKLTLTPTPGWEAQSFMAFKHTADGVMAFTIKEFHTLTRQKHAPLRMHLTWEQHGSTSEYERVFDCPVLFCQESIAIFFRKEHVEQKVVTANYDLLRVLVAHAEEKSAKRAQERAFISTVRHSIINLIKPEFPSIEQVAAHLNISARTLQRKLQDEGQSYRILIDSLKKEFAISYLKRSDLNISQVAYLLDYNDVSAFTRSFKRWTGESPNAYRSQL